MSKKIIFVAIVLISILASTVYYVEQKVDSARTELNQINKQMERDFQETQVLKAEFAYLTQPSVIRKLAEKHLNMAHTKPTKIVRLENVPYSEFYITSIENPVSENVFSFANQ